ncbi:PHP domain-containing protein [Candidatus Woesearchaeota archaeon]|nr:PHP domain-containing protein [Candidatus Woesearchaeota archaeon]
MPNQKESTIDLHFHSLYSDAEEKPENLVYKLAKINSCTPVKAACLTDHNTLRGQVPFQNSLRNYNKTQLPENQIQEGIFGVEVTLEYQNLPIHILAYSFPEPRETSPLNRFAYFSQIDTLLLKHINDGQRERYYRELQLARQQHPDLEKEIISTREVLEESGEYAYECSDGQKGFNHIHIASAIAKKTGKPRKTEYFERGGPFYLSSSDHYFKKIPIVQGLSILKQYSTEIILAHPKRIADLLSRKKVEKLISQLARFLTGIEVYASIHSPDDIDYYNYLMDKFNFSTTTAGSDFHTYQKEKLCHFQNDTFLPNTLKNVA